MTRARSESTQPLTDRLVEMLKSDDGRKVGLAAWCFVRIGTPAAEWLIRQARNKRLKNENRLRFLAVAREIGVPLNPGNASILQDLIEYGPDEVAQVAAGIVADASPNGAAGVLGLQGITGRIFGIDSFIERCVRSQKGTGRHHVFGLGKARRCPPDPVARWPT